MSGFIYEDIDSVDKYQLSDSPQPCHNLEIIELDRTAKKKSKFYINPLAIKTKQSSELSISLDENSFDDKRPNSRSSSILCLEYESGTEDDDLVANQQD